MDESHQFRFSTLLSCSKVSECEDNISMSKKNGFTLVEVMIVVAIIALLATIAAPGYMQVVRRGRAPEAIATMSTIRQALRDYFISHGTYYDIIAGNIDEDPPTGVGHTVGIAQYFSEAAFSVDDTPPAWTGAGISPAPVDFVITADGSASVPCGASHCAMNQNLIDDFRLEMDNTGRVFISYDGGTSWTQY